MPTKADAPLLPGVITIAEAAVRLGISKQAIHQHADNGRIRTLARVPSPERSIWVMAEHEIPDLRARLDAARTSSGRYHGNDSEEAEGSSGDGNRPGGAAASPAPDR